MKNHHINDELFKFHLSGGNSISIWSDCQKNAIIKLRGMCPDVVFMTDAEMKRRMREQMDAEERKVAGRKEKAKAEPAVSEESHPFLVAAE